jgi:hypothetical protein
VRARSAARTTGPPVNRAGGGRISQTGPAGYTAIKSHTMLRLSCSPSKCEIDRCLSQNCKTRESGIRPIVAVEGGAQSVGNTGSHTTNTRKGRPAKCFRIFSTAEAPCRQTGQVGESRRSNLTSSLDPLNTFLISATFCEVRFRREGWPFGAWCPHETLLRLGAKTVARTATRRYPCFILFTWPISSQRCLPATAGKRLRARRYPQIPKGGWRRPCPVGADTSSLARPERNRMRSGLLKPSANTAGRPKGRLPGLRILRRVRMKIREYSRPLLQGGPSELRAKPKRCSRSRTGSVRKQSPASPFSQSLFLTSFPKLSRSCGG